MAEESSGITFSIREALQADCESIWRNANDPAVRSASFSSDYIEWNDHKKWYSSRLSDPNCKIWLAFDDLSRYIGQVRFDLSNSAALISIAIDAAFRGKGIGAAFIARAVQKLFRETAIEIIYAHIKPENVASARAFEKAGFVKQVSNSTYKGHVAVTYELARKRYGT